MAVATWSSATQGVQGAGRALAGRLILGATGGDPRATATYDVDGVRVGRRGVTFPFPTALEPGRFAWVELTLGGGRVIKPLVAVLGAQDGVVSARIVHCFPEHQRALEAHLASASGY